jgi:hypothetical protein
MLHPLLVSCGTYKRGIPSEPRTVHAPTQVDPEKLAQLEAVQRWFQDDWRRIEPKLRTSIVHRLGREALEHLAANAMIAAKLVKDAGLADSFPS